MELIHIYLPLAGGRGLPLSFFSFFLNAAASLESCSSVPVSRASSGTPCGCRPAVWPPAGRHKTAAAGPGGETLDGQCNWREGTEGSARGSPSESLEACHIILAQQSTSGNYFEMAFERALFRIQKGFVCCPLVHVMQSRQSKWPTQHFANRRNLRFE